METLIIKIRDSKVLKLIHDLEDLNLIKIENPDIENPKVKLSELLAGSISEKQAREMLKELKQMRS